MPQFKLTLLGAPTLAIDGEPLALDTRKALALLAYLIMTAAGGGAHSHTRDALAALLWPDLDQSRARAALRRTLSPLRQAIDWRILDVSRDAIGLRPAAQAAAALWVDAVEFQHLLGEVAAHAHHQEPLCNRCRARLQQAVALYRDDFMAGFSLRDAPAFDEWHYFESEQLRRAFAGALEQLTHDFTHLGDYDRAIELARRHLALDPLAEQAHRSLMQLYTWSGQRSMAVRQYRDCVRILEQELGVAPLEETTALYERILGDDLPPPLPPHATPAPPTASQIAPAPPPPAHALPLVGRDEAWMQLEAAYATTGNQGRLLLIEGEAGIGKTRLAEAFLQQATGPVLRARCYEGESNLAYVPFIGAMRQALEQAGNGAPGHLLQDVPHYLLSEAARLLPELRPAVAPALEPAERLSGPGAQSRFYEAICRVLIALTTPRDAVPGQAARGVFFIDDVHWADDASLELLSYLVMRLPQRPLFVLLTWRPELLPANQRLQLLLSGAQRSANATRLALQRLSAQEVDELLDFAQEAGQPISPDWRDALYRTTEGLPFFIVEYLNAARRGELHPDQRQPPGDAAAPAARHLSLDALLPLDSAGLDPAAAQSSWAVPPAIHSLLQSRLDGVDEIGWQLLNTAAVIGRSFDFDTCRIASGRSEEEAVTAIEALLARGLIVELPAAGPGTAAAAPHYDFSHNQIRALVYHDTSLVRRRLLHRRVAEALAQRAPDASQAAQIARHFLLAGQEASAAAYFWRAGEHARSLYANATALSHLRAALALGYADQAAIHEAMGDLHTLLGDYEQAVASYEAAAAHAAPPQQPRLEHRLGAVYDRCGEWQRAESHFQAALAPANGQAAPAPDVTLQARVHADWSLTAHRQGHSQRALQLAHEARRLAQQAGDATALAQVHNILGILARHAGEPQSAESHLLRSLALATEAGLATAHIAALNNLALVYGEAGQPEQAQATLEQALQLCQAMGDRHREAAILNNLADLHHAAARSEEAMVHLKRAAAIFAEIGADLKAWQPEIWKLSEW